MPSTEKKETKVLLALMAHEIFHREMEIDTSAVDWMSVLAEAGRHKVTALLYPTIRELDGVPENAFNKACGMAIAVAQASEAMLKRQREILDLLEARQVPCAVLKGTSVAYLYPHPELRTIGDIDILVDEENLDEACKALQADGFAPSYTAEKHLCLQKGAVWVEMHRMVSVFPESEKGRFTKRYMTDALRHTQVVEISGVRFPMLSDAYQIIALLAHMEQHLATSGIGLRQVCDWAVTAHALRNCFDGETLALLERCGLLRFAQIMTRLCEKHLGLPPCSWITDASDALVDAMLADCLSECPPWLTSPVSARRSSRALGPASIRMPKRDTNTWQLTSASLCPTRSAARNTAGSCRHINAAYRRWATSTVCKTASRKFSRRK